MPAHWLLEILFEIVKIFGQFKIYWEIYWPRKYLYCLLKFLWLENSIWVKRQMVVHVIWERWYFFQLVCIFTLTILCIASVKWKRMYNLKVESCFIQQTLGLQASEAASQATLGKLLQGGEGLARIYRGFPTKGR